MSKYLSIVGPTAVGKTDFALQVARELTGLRGMTGVDLIAADSRQVYRDLPIVSGVDVPAEFQARQMPDWSWPTFFEAGAIRLFGTLLIPATESWSVGQFQTYAHQVMSLSWQAGRLPIIVGGTGLYVEHILTSDSRLHVPPNLELRQQAEQMTLEELQLWLQRINQSKWLTMNQSDRHNPRRLIRAIEISSAETKPEPAATSPSLSNVDQLVIGLNDDLTVIEKRIAHRVQARWRAGAITEVERLLANYPDVKLPIWSATGVKPLLLLTTGQINQAECLELWTRQERQYAKRQLTWWKKRPAISWVQVSEAGWQRRTLDQIEAWLSR